MNAPKLRRITEVPCSCMLCDWRGLSGECLPDDDGGLLCPRCASYDLQLAYLPHEEPQHGRQA